MIIRLTEQVHDTIARAAVQGEIDGVEMGGSLVTVTDGRDTLVALAIPTGPSAEQSFAHLRTDAHFQNHALDAIRDHFPDLQYAGDWHVHPRGMNDLSSVDRATARGILEDPDFQPEELILGLGIPQPKGPPTVRIFRATLDDDTFALKAVDYFVVGPEHPDVLALLGAPLPLLDDVMAPVEVPVTEPVSARIIEDVADLERRLGLRVHLRRSEGLWGAELALPGRAPELLVLFPPEYPAGAPSLLRGSLHSGPLTPVPLPYGWSSLHRLVDWVERALGGANWTDDANGMDGGNGVGPVFSGVRRAVARVLRTLLDEGHSR